MTDRILILAAVIFFLLAAFRVPARVGWWELGWACLAATLVI